MTARITSGRTTRKWGGALAWIEEQEDSFCRVEKDFGTASACLDAMAQGYAGVSTYNSTQNSNVSEFVRRLWPQLLTGYDENHDRFANTVRERTMASLAGIKYLLSYEPVPPEPGYELCHQEGALFVYRNPGADSIGTFFGKVISEEQYEEQAGSLDTWGLLEDVLIVGECGGGIPAVGEARLEDYRKEELELLDEGRWDGAPGDLEDGRVEVYDQHFITLPLKKEGTSGLSAASVEFTLGTDSGTEIQVWMDEGSPHVSYHHAGRKSYAFAVPPGTSRITIQITNSQIHAVLDNLRFCASRANGTPSLGAQGLPDGGARIRLQKAGDDGRLLGDIRTETDGMAMVAVPFGEGWHVYLDGEEQRTVRGDYGFLAFYVEAGEHTLKLCYRAPLFREGLAVSLAALAVLIWLWARRAKNENGR